MRCVLQQDCDGNATTPCYSTVTTTTTTAGVGGSIVVTPGVGGSGNSGGIATTIYFMLNPNNMDLTCTASTPGADAKDVDADGESELVAPAAPTGAQPGQR